MRATADIALGKIAFLSFGTDCRVPEDPEDEDCLESWVDTWEDTVEILTVHEYPPTYTVTSVGMSNLQNERLQKVGRTTGRTIGPVKRTCVDYDFRIAAVRCSDFVDFLGGKGDSGAPVFKVTSHTESKVELRGILWAGAPSGKPGDTDGPRYALISPVRSIFASVGRLWVQAEAVPVPPVVRIEGPTLVPPLTECRWFAHVSGGIEPYTYSWRGPRGVTGSDSELKAVIHESGPLTVTVTDWGHRTAKDSIDVVISPLYPSECLGLD